MPDRKFDWLRILLLTFAVAAALLSLLLVRMSAGQKPPEFLAWACGEAPKQTLFGPGLTGCDKALRTMYASIRAIPPRPVPTAVLGLAYFTFIGFWVLMVSRLPGRLHRVWLIPSIVGLFGLAVSAGLIYVIVKTPGAHCGLCIATHALNLPLVLGIWILWLMGPIRQPADQGAAAAQPIESFAASQLWKIPLLVLLIGIGISLAQIRDAQTADAVRALDAESNRLDQALYTSTERVQIPIDDEDPVLGPVNSPHTVVVFSDFECPYCAKFGLLIKEIQKELAVRQLSRKAGSPEAQKEAAARAAAMPDAELLAHAPFRLVFKHFPLNRDCNKYWTPAAPMPDHKNACQAAIAAEAARILAGPDAFWKMHDAIFSHRGELAEQPYTAFARRIGLDLDRFEKLRGDPATLAHIERNMREAKQAGVSGTPGVFLDGRRIERAIRQDSPNPKEKTTDMWARLLMYSLTLNQPATSQPATSRPAASRPAMTRPTATNPDQALREQLRRTRAAAIERAHAATQPAIPPSTTSEPSAE